MKMVIGVIFKTLKIVDRRDARNRKRVSQTGSERKENIRKELTVTSSYSKTIRSVSEDL